MRKEEGGRVRPSVAVPRADLAAIDPGTLPLDRPHGLYATRPIGDLAWAPPPSTIQNPTLVSRAAMVLPTRKVS